MSRLGYICQFLNSQKSPWKDSILLLTLETEQEDFLQ